MIRLAILFAVTGLFLATPSLAPAQEKKETSEQKIKRLKLARVGTTKDACDKGNEVRFRGRDGDVKVKADSSELVELPAVTRELTWFCGGTRERCANDEPFDFVLCERARNGAINWTFYKRP